MYNTKIIFNNNKYYYIRGGNKEIKLNVEYNISLLYALNGKFNINDTSIKHLKILLKLYFGNQINIDTQKIIEIFNTYPELIDKYDVTELLKKNIFDDKFYKYIIENNLINGNMSECIFPSYYLNTYNKNELYNPIFSDGRLPCVEYNTYLQLINKYKDNEFFNMLFYFVIKCENINDIIDIKKKYFGAILFDDIINPDYIDKINIPIIILNNINNIYHFYNNGNVMTTFDNKNIYINSIINNHKKILNPFIYRNLSPTLKNIISVKNNLNNEMQKICSAFN